MQMDKMQLALEAIRNVSDYHRERQAWPLGLLVNDMQFDDWASEVAACALAEEYDELAALTENVPPWEYDLTAGHFARKAVQA